MLQTAAPEAKTDRARETAAAWFAGHLPHVFSTPTPRHPARPDTPQLLSPRELPKRRKGGSTDTRKALLHAIAHIEFNAIDLAFDMVARFGSQMPREFTDDWVRVGDDEARHFKMVNDRLIQLGGRYGDLPAHDGLWQAAVETENDLAARLAIVPMVLEARGLDVTPGMIQQFRNHGDDESAHILQIILDEEVSHVRTGVKWFEYLCHASGKKPHDYFDLLVKRHFHGQIKPPFNHRARHAANMNPDYYDPASQA